MIRSTPKIAIFTSSMQGGGAQRAMLKVAGGIAARGYPVDLVLARAVGPFLNEVPESVRITDLGAKRVVGSLPALVRYLKHEQPDVMLTALDYVNLVALWARKLAGRSSRTKLVVSERNTVSSTTASASSRRARLIPALIRRCYPWADSVVAVSSGVAQDLAEQFSLDANQIHVIYNPIVTPELLDRASEPLDDPWFAADAPPVVLGAGRLGPQKDFATLIRAFAQLRSAQDARLMILGEGDLRGELEQLVQSLGLTDRVRLPGFVQNPYPYMARSGVFVLSSAWEGLPGVLIEALGCGAPVVATDCPSGPREILQDGRYGSLVPVGDVRAMAQAIDHTLAQRSAPPAESWERFVPDRVIQQYLDVLLEN